MKQRGGSDRNDTGRVSYANWLIRHLQKISLGGMVWDISDVPANFSAPNISDLPTNFSAPVFD